MSPADIARVLSQGRYRVTAEALLQEDLEAQVILRAIPKRKGSNAVFHFECMPESRIAYFWNTVRERAELGQFRLHDLRHNYASFAARSSETLPMIGKLLGHASVGTTQRYAHLDDETLLAAVERMGARIYTAHSSTS